MGILSNNDNNSLVCFFVLFKDSPEVTHGFQGEFFYKGFKITDDTTNIVDIRHGDFYSDVSTEDLFVLTKYGLIKGADILMEERDRYRVEYYQELIVKANNDITRFKRMHKLRPKYNGVLTRRKFLKEYRRKLQKRIDNTYLNIDEYTMYKALYEIKVKNNNNNKTD